MAAPARRKTTEVAVGVLVRADGCVLLADRPAGKPYAGFWEFPGGKIEAGESVAAALARELHEELGIDIGVPQPWVRFEFDYPHAYVRLHFCRVFEWHGTPRGREGQRLDFFAPHGVLPEPLLPAAVPALKWLTLPTLCAISNAAELGIAQFLARVDAALMRGLRLIILREPLLAADAVASLVHELVPRTRSVGATLLVSSRHPPMLWQAAEGVHLTAHDLNALPARAALPVAVPWLGASAHTAADLAHAARIGCDFALLGSVCATPSHPGAQPIGWPRFAEHVRHAALPTYALGGLAMNDLETAQRHGAHGIAAMRAAWRD